MDPFLIPPYAIDREAIDGKSVRFSLTINVDGASVTVANGNGIIGVCGHENGGVVEVKTHDSKNPNRHITYRLTEAQAKKLEKSPQGHFNLVA